MRNFPTICMARVNRIIVNLLLIVAITMQPTLTFAFQQGCSVDCTYEFTCQGCGYCKVQSETEKCPCCSGDVSDEHQSCCGHANRGESQQAEEQTLDDADPFAGMVLEAGPVPENYEQPTNQKQPDTRLAENGTLSSSCQCLSKRDPLDAPTPRSPLTELRDVLSLSAAQGCVVYTTVKQPLAYAVDAASAPAAPHFSQVSYCVWRL